MAHLCPAATPADDHHQQTTNPSRSPRKETPMTPSPKPPEPALAIPLRYDSVTMICPCGNEFSPSGRRRYCSDACKQKAWRSRHATPPIPGEWRRPTPSTSAPNAKLATWANDVVPTATSSPEASALGQPARTAMSPSPSATSSPTTTLSAHSGGDKPSTLQKSKTGLDIPRSIDPLGAPSLAGSDSIRWCPTNSIPFYKRHCRI